jgi:hypothetical protein
MNKEKQASAAAEAAAEAAACSSRVQGGGAGRENSPIKIMVSKKSRNSAAQTTHYH